VIVERKQKQASKLRGSVSGSIATLGNGVEMDRSSTVDSEVRSLDGLPDISWGNSTSSSMNGLESQDLMGFTPLAHSIEGNSIEALPTLTGYENNLVDPSLGLSGFTSMSPTQHGNHSPTIDWQTSNLSLMNSWPASYSQAPTSIQNTDIQQTVHGMPLDIIEQNISDADVGKGNSTLILEDMNQDTVKNVMDVLFQSNTNVKMKLLRSE
jgi:hypothetical protein